MNINILKNRAVSKQFPPHLNSVKKQKKHFDTLHNAGLSTRKVNGKKMSVKKQMIKKPLHLSFWSPHQVLCKA